jgi:hypothetical protein
MSFQRHPAKLSTSILPPSCEVVLGQVKEVLSTHAEGKAQFAEYGIRRGLS